MKFLFDIFPLILFFIAYQLADIYVATGVAIVATLGQVLWQKFRRGHVDKMLWAALCLIVVFGGMTIALRDPVFVQWKPTILYGLFASALLGSVLLLKKNPLRMILGQQIELPAQVWERLSLAWGIFFACLGLMNIYVARNFSEATWVSYNLFGDLGITLVFIVLQSLWLARYAEEDKPTEKESA